MKLDLPKTGNYNGDCRYRVFTLSELIKLMRFRACRAVGFLAPARGPRRFVKDGQERASDYFRVDRRCRWKESYRGV